MAGFKNKSFAVEFHNVSKVYRTYSAPGHRLLEMVFGGRKQYAHKTHALDDVSFSLERGGRLGIVGENGSGKSTLLKVLAGVLSPSAGSIQVHGRISALLELGAGFNPELRGEENIRQYCLLHGMNRDEVEAAVPEIIKFSELRDAIDHPVKTYSSGMAVRLGFSCAVYVKPEILIVDEALSVGDVYFQNKCLHKIKSLLDAGVTFIYVTHAADAIRSLCNNGIWMEKGRIRLAASSSEVGAAYQADVFRRMVGAGMDVQTDDSIPAPTQPEIAVEQKLITLDYTRHRAFAERVAPLRVGSGEAKIANITIREKHGCDTDNVAFNAQICIRVFYRVEQELPEKTALTIGVTDSAGRQILHFNSAVNGFFIPKKHGGELRFLDFEFENRLVPGEYGLMAGIGVFYKSPQSNGQLLIESIVDSCVGGARFSVSFPEGQNEQDLWGLVHLPYSVTAHILD